MIRPDQIPDEVVEVVAEEFFAADIFTNDLPDPRWQDVSELTRRIYRDFTRRTLLTAINAWPSLEVFIFPAAMEKEGEQKRLGPEFEAAIFSDVEGLYEADKSEGEA